MSSTIPCRRTRTAAASCATAIAPYANRALERTAKIYMKRVLSSLEYSGVLAIEFFVREAAG